ncbi:MAG: Gfo/Idh/MocA family protein [Actinomycetota bacterium]
MRRPTSPRTDAVLIGAGQRGHHVYGTWALAHSDRLRFVAVADPRPDRLARFGEAHDIPPSRRFTDPEALLAESPLAPACIVASPDRDHHRQVESALATGYHVLAEKPMASTLADCFALVEAAAGAIGTLQIAHVLRFTPFFQTLHRVIKAGRLGEIVTVAHRENVRSWHMAHSFVRGNWGRAATSAPMIVAKCTHDFDVLHWNLDAPVRRLSSYGSLFEFRAERAPENAAQRCTAPCPVDGCPYDARRVYLDPRLTGWPVHVLTDDLSPDGRLRALQDGPYGLCAYRAGSDVVDHQVVAMELGDGASVTLTMHGHSHEESRTMRYDGTRATLRGLFGHAQSITVIDHASGEAEDIPISAAPGGHGGGDDGIIEAFLETVIHGAPPATSAAESMESHLLAFLAEEARISGTTIAVDHRRRFS